MFHSECSDRGRSTSFMEVVFTKGQSFFFDNTTKKRMSLALRGGYEIQDRLGRGSFGEVYECTGPNGEALAAKLEPRRSEGKARGGPSQLRYEERVYRLLEGGDGIPSVVEYFTDGDYNILIMQRMGKSLEDVLEEQGGTLSSKTVLALGVRLLQALRHIHNKGMIHRDLKPQNMMLSTDNTDSRVYLIDFGLSKRFMDPVSGHVEYARNRRGLTGTPRYASVSSHLGAEQSRRDDLESLVYILLYLRTGKLPWQGLPGKTKKEKYKRVREMKQRTSSLRLSQGFPEPYLEFVDRIRGLGFEEDPPYERLMGLLREAATQEVEAGTK